MPSVIPAPQPSLISSWSAKFSTLNQPNVKQANPAMHNNLVMGKRASDVGTTDLGLRIKARRKELGWNQETLAKKSGCTKSAVSQWETGDVKNLHMTRVMKVADALDVELRWLISGESPKLRLKASAPIKYTIDEAEAIKNLRVAEPAYRRYVISLALMTPEQQHLMVKTMREAVPDSVVEAAYGKPPSKKN